MKTFEQFYNEYRVKKGLKEEDKIVFEDFVEDFKNNKETSHITKDEVFDFLLEKGRKLYLEEKIQDVSHL